MRLALLAGFMLCGVVLLAQDVNAQEAHKVHSMTGCLKAGPTPYSYMLTDLAKGPKTVGIVSSAVNLAPYVGLTIPVVVWSADVQLLLGYTAPSFNGSKWIPSIFGTIVLAYGGIVILRGTLCNLANRKPGMMTLVSLGVPITRGKATRPDRKATQQTLPIHPSR